ncbi:hypothetical protein NLG97_g9509 [Lecanicillium saksenae]|uniref:Uncharacterized protein n=1 Tax=Lecanicillium saksenae TaxID=468837 RepID=A0ACC1QFU4_9HYPO|nr:hypothetical protein NLG97_g9509 [Lecanicillium saksenae]
MLRMAAFVGLTLQCSVLWFAALTTYRWRWKKNNALAPPWAFPMMVCGTAMQCAGMWCCAHLINASTKERVFYKNAEAQKRPSALIVVQPGNQIIGDQTFDSCLLHDPLLPMREYVTSWKDLQEPVHPGKTVGSVTMTMMGFILQFVSLRAMHSAVSVFQLGAILTMTFIRSMIRTQRLKREENLLWDRPDQLRGHELDWLALKMDEHQACSDDSSWETSVFYRDFVEKTPIGMELPSTKGVGLTGLQFAESLSAGIGHVCAIVCSTPDLEILPQDATINEMHAEWLKKKECTNNSGVPHAGARMFYNRARLARLTKPLRPSGLVPQEAWGDQLVKARSQVRQLKAAIEESAGIIFSLDTVKSSWKNALSDPAVCRNDSSGYTVSTAEDIPTERVLFLTKEFDRMKSLHDEMKLWIEEYPEGGTLSIWAVRPGRDGRTPATLWCRNGNGDLQPRPKRPKYTKHNYTVRLLGLQHLIHADVQDNVKLVAMTMHYENAQLILQGAWAMTSKIDWESRGNSRWDAALAEKKEILMALLDGFDWVRVVLAQSPPESSLSLALHDVLDGYFSLAMERACNYIPSSQEIIEAISEEKRAQALWLLSQEGIELLTPDSNCRTVLSWAAQRGWTEIVKAALTIGSNVDAVDNLRRTALSYATEFEHIGVIEILLHHQASPTIADRSGRTPLLYAASDGSIEAIEILLKDGGTTIKCRDTQGRSALHCAAEKGRISAVKALLKDGRSFMIDEATESGITPLLSALVRDYRRTAVVLIRAGASWWIEVEGQKPWRWAVNHGHWTCTKFILEELNRHIEKGKKTAISIQLTSRGCKVCEEPKWESLSEKGGLFLQYNGNYWEIRDDLLEELREGLLKEELRIKVYEVREAEESAGDLQKRPKIESIPYSAGSEKILELITLHPGREGFV